MSFSCSSFRCGLFGKGIDHLHAAIDLPLAQILADDFKTARLLRGRDDQSVIELNAVFLLHGVRVADEVERYVRLEQVAEVVKIDINLVLALAELSDHRI